MLRRTVVFLRYLRRAIDRTTRMSSAGVDELLARREAKSHGDPMRPLTLEEGKIVEAYAYLVLTTVRRLQRGTLIPFADLVQKGNMALMYAAQTYDAERGRRFRDWAELCITRSVLRAHERERARKRRETAIAARRVFFVEIEKEVLPDEEVWHLLELHKMMRALDAVLTEEQRAVIFKRFGLEGEPLTLEEVAKSKGLSIGYVRKIERVALISLRDQGGIRDFFYRTMGGVSFLEE